MDLNIVLLIFLVSQLSKPIPLLNGGTSMSITMMIIVFQISDSRKLAIHIPTLEGSAIRRLSMACIHYYILFVEFSPITVKCSETNAVQAM